MIQNLKFKNYWSVFGKMYIIVFLRLLRLIVMNHDMALRISALFLRLQMDIIPLLFSSMSDYIFVVSPTISVKPGMI